MPVPRQSFVPCRSLRHAWEKTTPTRTPRTAHEVVMGLVCVRCGTVRNDRLEVVTYQGHWVRAELLSRTYDYPPGYSDVRKSAAEWRVDFMALNSPADRRRAPRNEVAERRRAKQPTPTTTRSEVL